MNKPCIKIQGKRYRLSGIKRYYDTDDGLMKNKKYCLHLMFSFVDSNARVIHYFAKKASRDLELARLDNILLID